MIKICKRCGHEFDARTYNTKYCDDCRHEAYLEWRRRYYQICREKQLTYGRRYYEEHREQRLEYRRRRYQGQVTATTFETRICERCGQEFTPKTYNMKRCPKCREEYQKEALREYYRAHKNSATLTCARCGAKFEGHGNRKYCNKCRADPKIQTSHRSAVKKPNVQAKTLRERYFEWRKNHREI